MSPSFGSLEPLPSRLTVAPAITVWSGPALADGAWLGVLAVTVQSSVSVPPFESVTVSVTMIVCPFVASLGITKRAPVQAFGLVIVTVPV